MKQLLAELFEAYYKDVYTYLYSLCRDAALAEDLASEVFLEVVKSVSSFRGDSDIRTWLFSIARHRWYAWLRRKKRQVPALSLSDLGDVVPAGSAGEVTELIWECLSREPPLTQNVVRMRIDGYSYHEIAMKNAISENSARVIFFRAKTKIRKYLEKEGFCYE